MLNFYQFEADDLYAFLWLSSPNLYSFPWKGKGIGILNITYVREGVGDLLDC